MDGDNSKSPLDYFTEESFVGGGFIEPENVLQEESMEVEEDVFEESPETEEPEETALEEEKEVEEISDEIEDEVEEDENIEEPDTATRAYFFAKAFVEDGTLPEDFELSEDISGEELKEALLKEAVGNLDVESYAMSQGYSEEVFRTAQYLVEGVHPDFLYEANRYRYASEIDLNSGEDVPEAVLREYYKDLGYKESHIDSIILKSIEDGTEIADAEEAQEYFKQKAEEIESEQREKIESQKQARIKAKEEVIDKIRSLSVKGLDLDKKEAESLVDYLYNEREVETVVIDGKKQRRMVSKFQKDYNSYTKDYDEFIKFAYNMMKGFDAEAIKQNVVVEAATKQIDALNRRTAIKGTKNKDKEKKGTDLFAGFQQII